MKREQARTVLLVIAAWVMGALMGSQVQRPAIRADAQPYFKPGRYRIEAADRSTYLFVTFNSNWIVEPW